MDVAWVDRIVVILDIEMLLGEQCVCKLLFVLGLEYLHADICFIAAVIEYLFALCLCYYY